MNNPIYLLLFSGPPSSEDKPEQPSTKASTQLQHQPNLKSLIGEAKSNNVTHLNTSTTITRNAIRSSHHRLVTTKQYAAASNSAAAAHGSVATNTITTNSRSQQVVAIRELPKNMQPVVSVSTNSHQSASIQQHSGMLQQQLGIQSHHGNIILVRGSRNENGQIILQNSHELLSLLNDSDDKPILLQNPRFKASASTAKLLHQHQQQQHSEGGTILLQSGATLKAAGSIEGNVSSGHHVLLQSSGAVKKSTSLPEGSSIIVQQRVNKLVSGGNGGNDAAGPILLQTLKRLDKSQSILVFRNSGSSAATATATTVSAASGASGRLKSLIVSAAVEDDCDKKEMAAKVVMAPVTTRSVHTPLGSGK